MLDILHDEFGDIVMVDGDIQYGESTRQHQKDILLARQGEYRTAPTATVGAIDYIDDDEADDFNAAVRIKFKQDGMQIDKISTGENGKLEIIAKYS